MRFTELFLRRYKKLPSRTKKNFEKQLTFLLKDLSHPSLRAKKYEEWNDVWQARVNSSHRFYFQIKKNTCVVLNIRKHKK